MGKVAGGLDQQPVNYLKAPRNDLHPAGRQIWIVGIDGSNEQELFNIL